MTILFINPAFHLDSVQMLCKMAKKNSVVGCRVGGQNHG